MIYVRKLKELLDRLRDDDVLRIGPISVMGICRIDRDGLLYHAGQIDGLSDTFSEPAHLDGGELVWYEEDGP